MLKITDFKLVHQNCGKTIFEDGKSKKGIKNEYGFCNFELFWKEKKVYQFGHFKKNNWHTNSYTLFVEMTNNKLAPSLDIVGRDSLKTKLFFRKL